VPQHDVHYVESSPADQLQPKLHAYPYLKAGDEIPVRKPRLFDVAARKQIPIGESLFPNPWDISDIRWSKDSSRFTFLHNQRGHQAMRIIAVDAASGDARAIVDEQSKTFIDYSGKQFIDFSDDAHEIIWMSERDGWNHLYLYDADSGEVKNQITRGKWVVRGVDLVDHEKRQIWFHAGGIRPEQDPYFVHYCRVNFDGSGLVILTEGNGSHSIQYSPGRKYLIDTFSRVDAPPIMELRRSEDGHLLCKLEQADAEELLAVRHRFPEPFVAKGRDGKTDIFGVIYRPLKFESDRKYPIIESIYAGPQDAYVPKTFRAVQAQQTLADHGFIVVQMDGMGTSNRSKAFHDVCWKNLGDAGFPDRIAWIKAAAAKHPEMDLSRIGIYGTSAGGQNALGGLLLHADFYTCGVADSGCHDNRMDKIWWNEQWMGYPVGPEYAQQSNVTNASKLRGPLLLMAGEDDENVDPASTMQVVNALIKSNKRFDLLIMPGRGHGVLATPYGRQRMYDFFQMHLLGKPPEQAPKE
jgi:dipeptidyl-peptidase-4